VPCGRLLRTAAVPSAPRRDSKGCVTAMGSGKTCSGRGRSPGAGSQDSAAAAFPAVVCPLCRLLAHVRPCYVRRRRRKRRCDGGRRRRGRPERGWRWRGGRRRSGRRGRRRWGRRGGRGRGSARARRATRSNGDVSAMQAVGAHHAWVAASGEVPLRVMGTARCGSCIELSGPQTSRSCAGATAVCLHGQCLQWCMAALF